MAASAGAMSAPAGAPGTAVQPENRVAVSEEAPHSPILPLTEIERRAIMNALEYTRGDRAVAAHLLGIGRTTLYRKLKEYNLAV